jgi:putative transposase
MRKSRFTGSQILAALKEGEAGVQVAELARRHGISRNTYFKWKAKHGGATVPELRRLRELEAENAKLKRMYADLALENTAIKDLLSRKL